MPGLRVKVFELYSEEYDDWFERNRSLYKAELKALKQLIPSKNLYGMEVGVGTGRFAEPLGIKVGVEPSVKMAEKARKRGIKVYNALAEDLPFPDNEFDFVLMVTTICFLDNVSMALKNVYRVLKENGFIIVGFINRESVLGKQYLNKKEKSKFYKEAVFFSVPEVIEYLQEAGMRIESIKQTLIPGAIKKVASGFDKGAFIAIKAIKDKVSNSNLVN